MTILREWRGRSKPEKADATLNHYLTKLKPIMSTAPGFIGASISSRDIGGLVEFILISRWRDMDAVKAFAGHAPEKAVLPEGTENVLEDSDNFVRLFEILDEV